MIDLALSLYVARCGSVYSQWQRIPKRPNLEEIGAENDFFSPSRRGFRCRLILDTDSLGISVALPGSILAFLGLIEPFFDLIRGFVYVGRRPYGRVLRAEVSGGCGCWRG